MIDAFGGKCGICGYNKTHRSLCFHHTDGNIKDFILGNAKSWAKIVVELRKCVLLCANCHGEVHDGLLEIPNNVQMFDETFEDYKHGQLFDVCPICGNEKYKKLHTCSRACAAKATQKIDWDGIDLVELLKQTKSFVGTGDMLGVSGATVKKRLVKMYGIDSINNIRRCLPSGKLEPWSQHGVDNR